MTAPDGGTSPKGMRELVVAAAAQLNLAEPNLFECRWPKRGSWRAREHLRKGAPDDQEK